MGDAVRRQITGTSGGTLAGRGRPHVQAVSESITVPLRDDRLGVRGGVGTRRLRINLDRVLVDLDAAEPAVDKPDGADDQR